MVAVRYTPKLVVDPGTGLPNLAVRGQSALVVAEGTDTPVTLTEDRDGTIPMPNPVTITEWGFTPAWWVQEGLTRVEVVAAGVRTPVVSPQGLEDAAQALAEQRALLHHTHGLGDLDVPGEPSAATVLTGEGWVPMGTGGGGTGGLLVLDTTDPVPDLTPARTVILRADLSGDPVDPPDHELEAVVSSATTARATSTASLTLARPAGVQDGDLLVACLTNQQAPPASPGPIWQAPAGWITLHELFSPTDVRSTGLYALAVPDADALTDEEFTFVVQTSAGRSAAVLLRCTGVDLTTPVLATSGAPTTGTDTVTIPSMSLPQAGLVLAGFNLGAVTAGNTGQPGAVDDADLVKVAEVFSADGTTGTRSSIHTYAGVKGPGPTGALTHTWPATVGGRGGLAVALRGA